MYGTLRWARRCLMVSFLIFFISFLGFSLYFCSPYGPLENKKTKLLRFHGPLSAQIAFEFFTQSSPPTLHTHQMAQAWHHQDEILLTFFQQSQQAKFHKQKQEAWTLPLLTHCYRLLKALYFALGFLILAQGLTAWAVYKQGHAERSIVIHFLTFPILFKATSWVIWGTGIAVLWKRMQMVSKVLQKGVFWFFAPSNQVFSSFYDVSALNQQAMGWGLMPYQALYQWLKEIFLSQWWFLQFKTLAICLILGSLLWWTGKAQERLRQSAPYLFATPTKWQQEGWQKNSAKSKKSSHPFPRIINLIRRRGQNFYDIKP